MPQASDLSQLTHSAQNKVRLSCVESFPLSYIGVKLDAVKPFIKAIIRKKLTSAALLGNLTIVHNDNFVGAIDSGETVSNDD